MKIGQCVYWGCVVSRFWKTGAQTLETTFGQQLSSRCWTVIFVKTSHLAPIFPWDFLICFQHDPVLFNQFLLIFRNITHHTFLFHVLPLWQIILPLLQLWCNCVRLFSGGKPCYLYGFSVIAVRMPFNPRPINASLVLPLSFLLNISLYKLCRLLVLSPQCEGDYMHL